MAPTVRTCFELIFFLQEIHRYKNEMASMETAVQERLGYLQRFKVSSKGQLRSCIERDYFDKCIVSKSFTYYMCVFWKSENYVNEFLNK